MEKSPSGANLWLCDTGPCSGPGEGQLVLDERIENVTTDPASLGLGAFEFQVVFDPNVFLASVTEGPYLSSTGRATACSMAIITENAIRYGCVSEGASPPGPSGAGGVVAQIHLRLNDSVRARLVPGNNNGVVLPIVDLACEGADILGHPLVGALPGGLIGDCRSAAVTVRVLEGDLNTDCRVDVTDEQMIAYRYGSVFGDLYYDRWYDLEPRLGDFDIDIKDVQKVFGRDGSTCQQPVPPQDPLPYP